jgi:type II secretory pathway pseudopilin PulG
MKTMKMRKAKSQLGFSLLELMVASAIGIIVIMAMTQMFRMAMNATFTVTQRAEVQENMRAGIELMTKDLSMAGAGLPSGGLKLASGTPSLLACNQAGFCYLGAGEAYPSANTMYGIIPGFSKGVESSAVITAAPAATNDSITSVYCDYNFPLSNFTFTFNGSGTQATVGVINAGTYPSNILANGGLNVGDLIFFLVSTAGQGTTSGSQGTSVAQTAATVGEITGIPSNTQIDFAAGDALNFNQGNTVLNSLAYTVKNLGTNLGANGNPLGYTSVTACRLNVVTYFLEVPAAGATVQTPRLMRQVNGLTAVPVADNIINLQFSYDVINNSGGVTPNQADPIGAGLSPALIQKVNMWVMGQSLLKSGTRYQSMYLASSVSARNMSFCNSYSSSPTKCN